MTSGVEKSHYPEHDLDEIVFLGRSNVGKSSFINAFVNHKKAAYVSSNPGKTQVLNFFKINDEFCFVDVPGYGYARVSKKKRQEFGAMIEEYLTQRINLKFAVLLVDFKVGVTSDDILMYDFLRFHHIETIVVATKKDKVKMSLHGKHKKNIITKMSGLNPDHLFVYSKEKIETLPPIYNYFTNKLGLEDEN